MSPGFMTPSGSPKSRYARLVEQFMERPNVTQEGKGFGSNALKVDGRIFAMLTPRWEFVVKLPRQRVEELIESGDGLAFDAGKGRPMKEWLVVRPTASLTWSSLAEEALAFVGTPRARRRNDDETRARAVR
jgi:hypothetical protein